MSGSFDRVMEDRKQLVNQIIDNMKNGYILPKPQWDSQIHTFHNPISNVSYKGANVLRLWLTSVAHNYTDLRFMTYKQAQSKGYQVKKGEKGVRLEKYKFTKQVEQENPDTGEKELVTVRLQKPIVNSFVVFNASQIDGIPPMEEIDNQLEHNEVMELADELIASSECPIHEKNQGEAFYSPRKDEITLPPRNTFINQEAFVSTMIHEMIHSTGHESRLNRPLLNRFGSAEYAMEELRAELGSFFMGTDLGIEGSEELLASHTHYLESWIKALENDPNELFRACSDAQKAVERLSGNLEQYREQLQEKAFEPVKMDLDEYLGQRGLSSPVDNYMLDKMKLPHGETYRQQQKRYKEADKVSNDYHNRRQEAIKEYYEKVDKGEIVPLSKKERTIRNAQGHPDLESTQAARRMLIKRGIMTAEEMEQHASQWDAAIEEAMQATELIETEMSMEM